MNRTRAFALSLVLQLYMLAALAALMLVAHASAAPTDTCDPAYTAQCCACEPSEAAEPKPLPVLYLPLVQRNAPGMSAEFAPWVPVPTVTPQR